MKQDYLTSDAPFEGGAESCHYKMILYESNGFLYGGIVFMFGREVFQTEVDTRVDGCDETQGVGVSGGIDLPEYDGHDEKKYVVSS